MSESWKAVYDSLQAYVGDSTSRRGYSERCRVALGEFQRRTGVRLWLRYKTVGDRALFEVDLDAHRPLRIHEVMRGHPSGCVVAFVENERLYMGSSFCCNNDRHRFSRHVGRWLALGAAVRVPWELSLTLVDSVELALTFNTAANSAVLADFHHWLCRNKLMVLDRASDCRGQFCDTAPAYLSAATVVTGTADGSVCVVSADSGSADVDEQQVMLGYVEYDGELPLMLPDFAVAPDGPVFEQLFEQAAISAPFATADVPLAA